MGTENRVAIVQHYREHPDDAWRLGTIDATLPDPKKIDEKCRDIEKIQGEQVRQLLARKIANRGLVEQPNPPQ